MTPPTRSSPPPGRWAVPLGVGLLALLSAGAALHFGACTQDDAFISFRYARNLLDGHGLVYNPGQHVEGFTNLSWTLLMAGLMGLGLDPVTGSVGLGVLSLIGLVLATAWLGRGRGALLAAALVALDPQVILESVEGLETTLFAALVAVGAALGTRGRPLRSAAVFGLAALTRPEGALIFGLLWVGLLLRPPLARSAALRAVAIVGGVLLALTAFRLSYYGDPLPNTFYAKTGGHALARGLAYLWAHVRGHPLLWALLLARPFAGPARPRTPPLATVVVGVLAYVAWVGGDFKPTGRFIQPVLPLMAVLAAETLTSARGRPAVRWGAVSVLALFGLWARVDGLGRAQAWADIRHANLEARRTVGLFLRHALPADTLIAVHSAGVVPYYAGFTTIDMWGLTDRHIARAPVPDLGEGLAGHERGDPAYVFGLDPDLYLPEEHLLALKPWPLSPEPGFPADFAERYVSRSIPVDGRWLNLWARRGFLSEVLDRG